MKNNFDFEFDFPLTNEQTTSLDEIPGSFGKFGWEKTNPIPICDISFSKYYLQALRLNDYPVFYERTGATSSDNILDFIDRYKIHDLRGKVIGNLYLCPYHLKNSEKVPEGLTLVDYILEAYYDESESLISNICDAIAIFNEYLKNKKDFLLALNPSIGEKDYIIFHEITSDYFMSEDLFDFEDFEETEFREKYQLSKDYAQHVIHTQYPFHYTLHLQDVFYQNFPMVGDLFEECYTRIQNIENQEVPSSYYELGFDEKQISRYLEAFGFCVIDNKIQNGRK